MCSKRTVLVMLTAATCLLLCQSRWADAQAPDKNAVAPTIQELMQERVKTLRRALEVLQLQYREGVADFRRVYEVQNALTEALVDATRSRAERIELLQQHCKTLEGSLVIAEKKFEQGAANEVDATEARASLLQAQIRLLQAQAPAAEQPRSKGTNEATGQAVPIVVRESDPEPISEVHRGQSRWSDAQAPDKNGVSPTIQELMEARIKTLQRAVEVLEFQFGGGAADASRVYETQNELADALVDATRSRAERIELLQQHCKTLEGLLLSAEKSVERGAANEIVATESRASLLQTQIRLLQAQAPAAEQPRSKGTNEATGQAVPIVVRESDPEPISEVHLGRSRWSDAQAPDKNAVSPAIQELMEARGQDTAASP